MMPEKDGVDSARVALERHRRMAAKTSDLERRRKWLTSKSHAAKTSIPAFPRGDCPPPQITLGALEEGPRGRNAQQCRSRSHPCRPGWVPTSSTCLSATTRTGGAISLIVAYGRGDDLRAGVGLLATWSPLQRTVHVEAIKKKHAGQKL